jgi:transglutaminase-like putative cysteine protease
MASTPWSLPDERREPMENYFSIRHVTRYRYSAPIRESGMQLYMQPRSEGAQFLRSFQITTNPRAQLFAYTDHLGNAVYHFDIPQEHTTLIIDVESTVEVMPRPALPAAVSADNWAILEGQRRAGEHFDMLMQQGIAAPSPLLEAFIAEHGLGLETTRSAADPLTALRKLNGILYEAFDYDQDETDVDSPIDHVLTTRRGVCQDFAHVMLSVLRGWGIPARYVSGYLFHEKGSHDRSVADASHAWVEAWLPALGWIGFDPTNNVPAAERHIRVAIGRDYADVPPTKGVYKGDAEGELAVAVQVTPQQAPQHHEDFLRIVRPMRQSRPGATDQIEEMQAQQQQQQ